MQAHTLQLGLSWSGRKNFELIASELSVSPDGRHVLYRPGHAPGAPLDRRLFLWDVQDMPGPPLALHHLDCHPDAPCPPVLGSPVHPPPAPDDPDAADPPVYPLHAVWDLEEEPPSERVGPEWSWKRKRVAFLALDRLGWLNLVVVPLLDDGPRTACRIPVVPYLGAHGTEEVRSLRYENGRAVAEMFGNPGVATVHRIPVPLWCRGEEELRREPGG